MRLRYSGHLLDHVLRESDMGRIHQAAADGNLKKIAALLQDGFLRKAVDVNVQDKYGLTPLAHAARNGRCDAAQLLIDRGAVVDTPTATGETSLHLAASANHAELIRLLLGRGGQLEARTKDGFTPLAIAAKSDAAKATLALVAAGADIKAANNDGLMPIHLAILEVRPGAALVLLANGGEDFLLTEPGWLFFESAAVQLWKANKDFVDRMSQIGPSATLTPEGIESQRRMVYMMILVEHVGERKNGKHADKSFEDMPSAREIVRHYALPPSLSVREPRPDRHSQEIP